MNISDIELKENSAEQLSEVQGLPTKHFIFAEEFNALVKASKLDYPIIKIKIGLNENITPNHYKTANQLAILSGLKMGDKFWLNLNNQSSHTLCIVTLSFQKFSNHFSTHFN